MTYSRRNPLRPAPLLLIGVLAFALVACGSSSASGPDPDTTLAGINGYTVVPDEPLGPSTASIDEAAGGSWSFAQPAAGKVTLVYFGYTDCPDVCPLTMNDLAVALNQVPASVSDKVWVQFVSTDPDRDTAARLTQWVNAYSPTFHGGRAPIDTVIAAARTYGISITAPKVTKGDYQVTHGAQVLVLDPQGGEVGFFSELVKPSVYAAALPSLVQKYAS